MDSGSFVSIMMSGISFHMIQTCDPGMLLDAKRSPHKLVSEQTCLIIVKLPSLILNTCFFVKYDATQSIKAFDISKRWIPTILPRGGLGTSLQCCFKRVTSLWRRSQSGDTIQRRFDVATSDLDSWRSPFKAPLQAFKRLHSSVQKTSFRCLEKRHSGVQKIHYRPSKGASFKRHYRRRSRWHCKHCSSVVKVPF